MGTISGGTPVVDTIWVLRCMSCQVDIELTQTHPTGDKGETLYHGPDDRNRIAEHLGHNMMAIEFARPPKG